MCLNLGSCVNIAAWDEELKLYLFFYGFEMDEFYQCLMMGQHDLPSRSTLNS